MIRVTGVGIIAEDKTDYETVKVLVMRLSNNTRVAYKKKVGDGCGRIANKCLAWSNELYAQKCNVLILIQDRDRNDAKKLKNELEVKLHESKMKIRFVCIPIEELEAWLLSDTSSIIHHYQLEYTPKFKGKPETITSPKEKLRNEIRRCSKNRIIHLPKHNVGLASTLDIETVKNRCPSFKELHDFVRSLSF